MRNQYRQACSICQGIVPPGEGTLRKEGPGWSVTHTDSCLRGISVDTAIRHGHARAYTRRLFGILGRSDASIDEIMEAVGSMAALVRTRWTTVESCERQLLNSKALSSLDRLSVEKVLSHLLLEDSHA